MYYYTKCYELSYYHAQFKTLIHYDIIVLIVKGLVDELSYLCKKEIIPRRQCSYLKIAFTPGLPKALPILLRA